MTLSKSLVVLILLSGCSKPTPPVADMTLPDMCRPWNWDGRSIYREINTASEMLPIPGEDMSRFYCTGSGPYAEDISCEAYGQINLEHFQKAHLWLPYAMIQSTAVMCSVGQRCSSLISYRTSRSPFGTRSAAIGYRIGTSYVGSSVPSRSMRLSAMTTGTWCAMTDEDVM